MEKTQILYNLRKFFQGKKNIKTVILYGSAAEDCLADTRDIDIAVGGEAPLFMEELLKLYRFC